MQKTDKIIGLTKTCWNNLEQTEALTSLLEERFMADKTATVALNMISFNIQNVQKTILDIQNEIL